MKHQKQYEGEKVNLREVRAQLIADIEEKLQKQIEAGKSYFQMFRVYGGDYVVGFVESSFITLDVTSTLITSLLRKVQRNGLSYEQVIVELEKFLDQLDQSISSERKLFIRKRSYKRGKDMGKRHQLIWVRRTLNEIISSAVHKK